MIRYVYILLFPAFFYGQSPEYKNAETFFVNEQFDKAKPVFEAYLVLHPADSKTQEYLGDIAAYNKDWDTAIDYYKTLVSKDNNNANYHFKYGGALGMKALSISKIRALGYIDDIKEHFTQAAELDPKHIDTRWALVELYLQLPGIVGGSDKKATRYAKELLQISPVDGYLSLGYIAEYNNDANDAERYYKKAIEIGGSAHTYEKLSTLYENNNQPNEAIDTASKSLKIHKRNQINYQIGKIAAQYNMKPELGIASLKRYIKNHSVKDGVPVDWAYYRMAQIYKNEGDKTSAMHYINLALADRPDFKEALLEKQEIKDL